MVLAFFAVVADLRLVLQVASLPLGTADVCR